MKNCFLINNGWCREPLICRAFLDGILFYTSTNFCWCRELLICRTLMFGTLIFVRLICRYALQSISTLHFILAAPSPFFPSLCPLKYLRHATARPGAVVSQSINSLCKGVRGRRTFYLPYTFWPAVFCWMRLIGEKNSSPTLLFWH
jgi:hypothetical protein